MLECKNAEKWHQKELKLQKDESIDKSDVGCKKGFSEQYFANNAMINLLSTYNLGLTVDTVWIPIWRMFGIFHNSSLICLPLFPCLYLERKMFVEKFILVCSIKEEKCSSKSYYMRNFEIEHQFKVTSNGEKNTI